VQVATPRVLVSGVHSWVFPVPARQGGGRKTCGESELNHGFDSQPPRRPDVFGFGMWHWSALDTPRNPDPPHQASLHVTTVAPVAPPGSAVSAQDRLSGRIRAYGRFWCTRVHKVLPQARILPDLDAGWTERALSAAPWPQGSAGGRGGHFRIWHAPLGTTTTSAQRRCARAAVCGCELGLARSGRGWLGSGLLAVIGIFRLLVHCRI